MGKYLSIGEVVKMKGVSHRALRHYDEMGILVPAYVNVETGYRYYAKSQMLILDIIQMCVIFGIPLKQFKSYMSSDGSIDVQKMAEDAQQKAMEMQKTLEQNLYFLHSLTEHFAQMQELALPGQVYTKDIAQRYFLTTAAPKDLGSWSDYWTNMTKLYTMVERHDFSMSVNQGLCCWKKDGVTEARYFVEIKAPQDLGENILVVAQGHFMCEVFEDECFHDALDIYTVHEHYLAGNMLILNDIFEQKITQKPIPFEVQLMQS